MIIRTTGAKSLETPHAAALARWDDEGGAPQCPGKERLQKAQPEARWNAQHRPSGSPAKIHRHIRSDR